MRKEDIEKELRKSLKKEVQKIMTRCVGEEIEKLDFKSKTKLYYLGSSFCLAYEKEDKEQAEELEKRMAEICHYINAKFRIEERREKNETNRASRRN